MEILEKLYIQIISDLKNRLEQAQEELDRAKFYEEQYFKSLSTKTKNAKRLEEFEKMINSKDYIQKDIERFIQDIKEY